MRLLVYGWRSISKLAAQVLISEVRKIYRYNIARVHRSAQPKWILNTARSRARRPASSPARRQRYRRQTTPTDDRRQRAKQYWPIRRASDSNNNIKRPDGTTFSPVEQRQAICMGCHHIWHQAMPSHTWLNISMTPGAAADQASQQKMSKYASLTSTHIFCPIAIETAWAVELVQELCRRITVTDDPRETTQRDIIVTRKQRIPYQLDENT